MDGEIYYLWKLKLVKGETIRKRDIYKYDKDTIYRSNFTGEYIHIPKTQFSEEEIDRLLKLRQAYNFKLLINCVVWITVAVVLSLA